MVEEAENRKAAFEEYVASVHARGEFYPRVDLDACMAFAQALRAAYDGHLGWETMTIPLPEPNYLMGWELVAKAYQAGLPEGEHLRRAVETFVARGAYWTEPDEKEARPHKLLTRIAQHPTFFIQALADTAGKAEA